MRKESSREILAFLIITFAAFLFVCLYSFDPLDYLYTRGDVQNVCGPLGAAVGFHMVRWVGITGAYGLTILFGLFAAGIL